MNYAGTEESEGTNRWQYPVKQGGFYDKVK